MDACFAPGAELAVLLALVAIAVGLVVVVSANLSTSANIRKESTESHILSEMQIALTSVEEAVAGWQANPAARPHPATDPTIVAAAAAFHAWADRLAAIVNPDELPIVGGMRDAFDEYRGAAETLDANLDQAAVNRLVLLDLAVRTPLLELLEHENDHLIESVAAGERSERLLRWGLPVLAILALGVLGSMVRLRARSTELDEQRRLNEIQTQFIATVSHELRTPLTAIVAYSHELRDRLTDFTEIEIAEFVAAIAQESDEVTAIVDDLLVAARIETGRLAMMPQVLDVAEQVTGALATITESDTIEVGVSGTVLADRGRLRQILRNLVSNAQRYGGAKILVLSETQNERTLIVVADSGPPIPAELRELIFEPFSSVPNATGVTSSVGLGLSVSRRLATMMGGELTYSHEDGWSRFNLVLPTAPRTDPAKIAIEERVAAIGVRRDACEIDAA